MLTDEQFAELVTFAYEPRGLEFKGARPRSDRLFFARVARSALGLANLRDGGYIIIGVDEQGGGLQRTGLSAADLATWRYDDVSAGFAEYADPPLDFDLAVHHYQGKQFVVLAVREFAELPIVCKKTYQEPSPSRQVILRAGACYIRSRRKPETLEVPSQTEMRELLDLAIEKGVRRFIARAHAVGLVVPAPPSSGDRDAFDQQRRDLEGT